VCLWGVGNGGLPPCLVLEFFVPALGANVVYEIVFCFWVLAVCCEFVY
jgi:hypothetical protein